MPWIPGSRNPGHAAKRGGQHEGAGVRRQRRTRSSISSRRRARTRRRTSASTRRSALREVPDAQVQFPDWVLIKTRLCGICGSDYKQVFIDFEGIDSPLADAGDLPAGDGARGGRHDRGRRAGGEERARRPARRAQPVAVVRAARHHAAVRGLPGRASTRCASTSSAAASRRASTPAPAATPRAATRRTCRRTRAWRFRYPTTSATTRRCSPIRSRSACTRSCAIRRKPGDIVVVYGCGTLGLCAIEILNKLFDVKIYAITRFDHQARLAKQLGAIETIPWRPTEQIIARFKDITGAAEVLPPMRGRRRACRCCTARAACA